ncbi:hypothetical protein [Streptomyces sp. NBC_00094]|nr:hypothetical protein [Streptomyces sp. NBC_00094]MCX5394562.1 hypothetical protein [Streptomyces sp. NBC_00094]
MEASTRPACLRADLARGERESFVFVRLTGGWWIFRYKFDKSAPVV